ncbi:Panacea domain-containing protein [Marinicrinis sediminis]|uniref:Panacea domain-containing protein n=1 Tax=Marinicrinis sediminis TaxID=1652465 RepID=A0ABW5RAN1_9BACL
MDNINYAIRYLVLNYPYKDELSKTRLTKMVYLADWKSAQKHHTQITNIKWRFYHFGPFVNDVFKAAQKDSKLLVLDDFSMYGTVKKVISIKGKQNEASLRLDKLTLRECSILDDIINETKYLNWSEFIDYVYDTYPIKTQRRYGILDLISLAGEEKYNR